MAILNFLLECISEALSSLRTLLSPPSKSSKASGRVKPSFETPSPWIKEPIHTVRHDNSPFVVPCKIEPKESGLNNSSVISKENKNRINKMPNQTHVVYNAEEKRWEIKKAGVNKPLDHRRLKLDAISVARSISKEAKSELVIHNRDGKISNRDSHGNDPKGSAG